MSEYFKKAYDWASTYDFEDIDIEYASKLALKMLDDSCQMNSHDREEIIPNMLKIHMKAYKDMVRKNLEML